LPKPAHVIAPAWRLHYSKTNRLHPYRDEGSRLASTRRLIEKSRRVRDRFASENTIDQEKVILIKQANKIEALQHCFASDSTVYHRRVLIRDHLHRESYSTLQVSRRVSFLNIKHYKDDQASLTYIRPPSLLTAVKNHNPEDLNPIRLSSPNPRQKGRRTTLGHSWFVVSIRPRPPVVPCTYP
jgi:hypothetical protein